MNNIVLPRNRILVQLFYAMFKILKLIKKLFRPHFFLTKKQLKIPITIFTNKKNSMVLYFRLLKENFNFGMNA